MSINLTAATFRLGRNGGRQVSAREGQRSSPNYCVMWFGRYIRTLGSPRILRFLGLSDPSMHGFHQLDNGAYIDIPKARFAEIIQSSSDNHAAEKALGFIKNRCSADAV